MARRYGINAVPTFVYEKNGNSERHVGKLSKREMKAYFH